MKSILRHKFEDIVSIDNLLQAWQEFLNGKRNKLDVQEFQLCLMDNILSLHYDLINKTYKHGGYQCFKINDPKPRTIHKASVRDRLLHHAVYRILYPYFENKFIADSFSCQDNKGTHKAINRFKKFGYVVSENNAKQCWILKCDIKKFFTSVDQKILLNILGEYVCHSELDSESKNTASVCTLDSGFPPNRWAGRQNDIINLLKEIIFSFKPNGLPLGNLTSQLFANVYLNKFDQFVKHKLKQKYYIRYADDFVIFSQDRKELERLIPQIEYFLDAELRLLMHPDKVYIKTLSSGVDFLGWVNFADHRILRTKTKRKMLYRIKKNSSSETLNSYLGLLKHGNSCRIKEDIFKYVVK